MVTEHSQCNSFALKVKQLWAIAPPTSSVELCKLIIVTPVALRVSDCTTHHWLASSLSGLWQVHWTQLVNMPMLLVFLTCNQAKVGLRLCNINLSGFDSCSKSTWSNLPIYAFCRGAFETCKQKMFGREILLLNFFNPWLNNVKKNCKIDFSRLPLGNLSFTF